MPFYVTEDHVKIYFESRGAGRPVVLLHGLTANHRHFKKQVGVLAKDFRVITVDLRGHGDSDVPEHGLTLRRLAQDLRELVDFLELEEVSLVGWSMGTHVIFEYIRLFSCRGIRKIIIIDMSPKLMKSDDWSYGLPGVFSRKTGDFGHEDNLFMLSVMLDNWERYSRIVAERILNRSLYNEKMEFDYGADFKGKEDLPWLYEEARRNTPHVIVALWISMSMQDYRSVLGEISVPCLIAYGIESNYYPPENYEYMRSRIPNAQVVPFEGCGHALHIQDPEKFNEIAGEFLRE
ncbi:MAG: alpha/beta hydrolase [Syntrophales bacterium]|nr:alpha/beta hydrolase [Syntrophales bacterium]